MKLAWRIIGAALLVAAFAVLVTTMAMGGDGGVCMAHGDRPTVGGSEYITIRAPYNRGGYLIATIFAVGGLLILHRECRP